MWTFSSIIHLFHPKLVIFFALLFLLRLALLTTLERRNPAHKIIYSEVIPKDIGATLIFILLVSPVSNFFDRHLLYLPQLPEFIANWPLALRFCLYLIFADFGHYWVHRMLHTGYMWRAHKWHHSPTYMYWLAGVRGSIVQQTLVNVPYILAGIMLDIAPWWMFWVIVLKNTFENDIMHLNVWWGNRWIEWVVVTPRYHHIHHSEDPSHYTRNLGTLLTIWDRLFGTYLDPDKVQRKLVFGIGEKVNSARLIIGI